jgi:hypothetical protein
VLLLAVQRRDIMASMGWRLRWLASAALFIYSLVLVPPASACSLVSCLGQGIELRREFVVLIKHDGRPLQGVEIEIKTNAPEASIAFKGLTDSQGRATIVLSPGEYWLDAELHGVSAAYQCFHVAAHWSIKAKRKLTYEWGDLAPSMRQIAGRVIESQAGTGGNLLWNLSHRVDVPINGVILQLNNAITGASFTTKSDDHGHFSFDPLPNGTYVLHIEPGSTDLGASSDLVIKVSESATWNDVVLKRQESDCGIGIFPSWK